MVKSWIFLPFLVTVLPYDIVGIMNKQIKVGTSVNCDTVDYGTVFPKAMLRHNLLGCHFLRILNYVYKINVTYVFLEPKEIGEQEVQSLLGNNTIDIYARPITLRLEIFDQVYPVHALFVWRVGFILRRQHKQRMLRKFYAKPFTTTVWLSLYATTFFAAVIFFILSSWERQLGAGGECSFVFELLLAIGGCCQHIFPVETITVPRRTAYFIFFMFTYVIYTFYTSNLLSHLVSDKEDNLDLEELSQSDYNYMFLDDIKDYQNKLSGYNSTIFKHIRDIPVVNISTGLEAVRTNKTALLSDFVMVNRELAKRFNYKEMCDIFEIDLYSKLPKYLVVSKDFRYKEEIKVSALRMQEAGLIHRLISVPVTPVDCSLAAEVTTSFQQISALLAVLIACYILTGVILMLERIHFCRNRVWPYVE